MVMMAWVNDPYSRPICAPNSLSVALPAGCEDLTQPRLFDSTIFWMTPYGSLLQIGLEENGCRHGRLAPKREAVCRWCCDVVEPPGLMMWNPRASRICIVTCSAGEAVSPGPWSVRGLLMNVRVEELELDKGHSRLCL